MQQLTPGTCELFKGKVDFGIITIKQEEFEAVLEFFAPDSVVQGQRYYNICRVDAKNKQEYIVGITSCSEQGTGEAQNVTRDFIEDLDPDWLMVVGIGGGIPDSEFSLGDVVVCNRLHDFCVSSFVEGGNKEFAQMGGPMKVEVQTLLSNLPAFKGVLEGWNSSETLNMEQPNVELGEDKFYGSDSFREKVKELVTSRFGEGAQKRVPKVIASSTASSDILVKDTELITTWKTTSRQIKAVEMELGGVYRAARRIEKEYPILAIRGISDIVGFKRSESWTLYACKTAASFAKHLILSGVIPPKKKPTVIQDDTHQATVRQDNATITNDIKLMTDLSEQAFKDLEDKSCIFINKENRDVLKINRDSSKALIELSEKSNYFLVIGDPGAGKSGALYDLVSDIRAKQEPYILFLADQFEARSLGELRNEIGLQNNLKKVIEFWSKKDRGYLIIDAMDAARSSESQATFRQLIQDKDLFLKFNWHVIVSIRKFDLKYSDALRKLFESKPQNKEFIDHDFRAIQHINIPKLSEREFNELSDKHDQIKIFIKESEPKLIELCRNLFNFKLIVQLLENGTVIDRLNHLESQLELLDLYWQEVVVNASYGQNRNREITLKQLTNTMVKNNKMEVLEDDLSEEKELEHLLKRNVLSERVSHYRKLLFYSHHILFDYAVFRVFLIYKQKDELVNLLENPISMIFLRPSFLMLFQELWRNDIKDFWDLGFKLLDSEKASDISKILPPVVIADSPYDFTAYEPLLEKINSDNPLLKKSGEDFFKQLMGALAIANKQKKLNLYPWVEFVSVALSNKSEKLYSYSIDVLREVVRSIDTADSESIRFLGEIGRNLLTWSWEQEPANSFMSTEGIRIVCATIQTDPSSSEKLLRLTLEPEHLAKHSTSELFWFAQNLKNVYPILPGLARDFYINLFAYVEHSDAQTTIGGESQIFNVLSNRKQDIDGIRYVLDEEYKGFLFASPNEATHALVSILESYINNEHRPSKEEVIGFRLNDVDARFVKDFSYIWDAGRTYGHDHAIRILKQYESYIKSLEDLDTINEVVNIIVSSNKYALLWKRLIEWGSSRLDTIGKLILSLAWTECILTSEETLQAIGEFITKASTLFSLAQRLKIEKAVLGISTGNADKDIKLRNRFMKCLSPTLSVDDFQTQTARDILRNTEEVFPSNSPLIKFGRAIAADLDDDDDEFFIDSSGVEGEEQSAKSDLDISELKALAENQLDVEKLDSVSLAHIFNVMGLLFQYLSTASPDSNVQYQKHLNYLAEATNKILSEDSLSDMLIPQKLLFLKEVTLFSLNLPREALNKEREDHEFDRSPGYAVTHYTTSACSLILLASKPIFEENEDLKQMIIALSDDSDPAIRYQIYSYSIFLYNPQPSIFWHLLTKLFEQESCLSIFSGTNRWLLRVAYSHQEYMKEKTEVLFEKIRAIPTQAAEDLRENCLFIHLCLFIFKDDRMSEFLEKEIHELPLFHKEFGGLIFSLRKQLSSAEEEVAGKTFLFLRTILRQLTSKWEEINRQQTSPEKIKEIKTGIIMLVDKIASQFHFASDEIIKDSETYDLLKDSSEARIKLKLLVDRANSCLNEIVFFRHPSVIHNLMEMMSNYIHIDPALVLNTVHFILSEAKEGGYQYEWQAKDVIIQMVNKIFADHREILLDSEFQFKLIEILDVFVKAGWLEARELTYNLEEVLR